jgi:hypothetical protein
MVSLTKCDPLLSNATLSAPYDVGVTPPCYWAKNRCQVLSKCHFCLNAFFRNSAKVTPFCFLGW